MSAYSIGDAARQSGVKVPTIRYYEGIGLLPVPARQTNNRRLYDAAAIGRLVFIRHAREWGFAVEDIRELLSLKDNPSQSCRDADRIARARLADVEARIERLNDLKIELKRIIGSCSQQRVADCEVMEAIADRSLPAHS